MPNEKKDQKVYAKISDSKIRDAGRGYARLDPIMQKDLNLHPGNGIEIKNPITNKRTPALVMQGYLEDANSGKIRIEAYNLNYNVIDL